MARFTLSKSKDKNTGSPPEDLANLILLPSGSGGTTAEEELRGLGIYYITGEISSGTLMDIHQDILLKYIGGWKDDFQIFINSPGGENIETWTLVDLLKFIEPRIKTRTIGIGQVQSAATVLLAAGTKGKRCLAPFSHIMVHQPKLYGYFEGQKDDILTYAEDMKLEYERFIQFWQQNSKCKTRKQVEEKLLPPRDSSLTPKQAIELGIADKIMK
jgi:ATP-dependent Clp protease protease subunit